LANTNVFALFTNGDCVFAGTNEYGPDLYLSTNNGVSWIPVNTGLIVNTYNTPNYITAFAVSGDNLFCGTASNCVWRRPLSEMTSNLIPKKGDIPLYKGIRVCTFGYLNTRTLLRYSIYSRCNVRLEIYTISGKVIASFTNNKQAPGTYIVKLEDSGMPSGLYVYRFQAGNYQESNFVRIWKYNN